MSIWSRVGTEPLFLSLVNLGFSQQVSVGRRYGTTNLAEVKGAVVAGLTDVKSSNGGVSAVIRLELLSGSTWDSMDGFTRRLQKVASFVCYDSCRTSVAVRKFLA